MAKKVKNKIIALLLTAALLCLPALAASGDGGAAASGELYVASYASAGDDESAPLEGDDALHGGEVSSPLVTERHLSYIHGYSDGTVRPDGDITRAEAAYIFWQLLSNNDKYVPVPGNFSDVQDNAWYSRAVNFLASLGIITGLDDGSFGPEMSITRAEFIAIAARFEALEIGANPFSDVLLAHWAHDYIISAHTKGWICGYPDSTLFFPDGSVTRAESVKIVNRIFGRCVKAENIPEELHDFYSDLPVSHWAFADIIEASISHDCERLSDGCEIYTAYYFPGEWLPANTGHLGIELS